MQNFHIVPLRFVGMIDAKDMQSFIIRAVTGMGKPYALQKENLSALDFNQMTTKIANLAGRLYCIRYRKSKICNLLVLFNRATFNKLQEKTAHLGFD